MTLPLTSTGTVRGGNSVSGGDTANVNEIMAPAAAITPLVASSCIACMARFVCPIRGTEMTKCDLHRHGQRHDGTAGFGHCLGRTQSDKAISERHALPKQGNS